VLEQQKNEVTYTYGAIFSSRYILNKLLDDTYEVDSISTAASMLEIHENMIKVTCYMDSIDNFTDTTFNSWFNVSNISQTLLGTSNPLYTTNPSFWADGVFSDAERKFMEAFRDDLAAVQDAMEAYEEEHGERMGSDELSALLQDTFERWDYIYSRENTDSPWYYLKNLEDKGSGQNR